MWAVGLGRDDTSVNDVVCRSSTRGNIQWPRCCIPRRGRPVHRVVGSVQGCHPDGLAWCVRSRCKSNSLSTSIQSASRWAVDSADEEADDAVSALLTDDDTTMLLLDGTMYVLLLIDDDSALLMVDNSTSMLPLDGHGASVLLMEETLDDVIDNDDSGAAVELGASTILVPHTPSFVVGAPSDDLM
jgi:hypothetical protein